MQIRLLSEKSAMKNKLCSRHLVSALAVVLVASVTVVASEIHSSGDVDLEGVKCVVASQDAQASKSADYKDGKVYFCCGGCSAKFAASQKKFATQANRQLVQTKQYEQTGCPFSGGKTNPDTAITVDGVKVAFCCGHCQAKVGEADPKAQSNLVFNEKAFKKGFAKKKSDES